MGCNYYLERKPCCECGADRSEHIGKLSAGHPFLFHGTKTENSWHLWRNRIERETEAGAVIRDEYGRKLFPSYLRDVVNKSYDGLVMRSFWSSKDEHEWSDEAGYFFMFGEFS